MNEVCSEKELSHEHESLDETALTCLTRRNYLYPKTKNATPLSKQEYTKQIHFWAADAAPQRIYNTKCAEMGKQG